MRQSNSMPFAKTATRSAAPRPLPPWLEQSLLFALFVGAALFWIAVIWWIVR